MFDFHEKRKLRRLIYSKVTIGIILLLCFLATTSVFKRLVVEREMAARRSVTEAELTTLEIQAATLKEQVAKLQDDRGLEAEMRNRFDVTKSGEQLIVIVEEDVPNTALPEAETEPEEWTLFSRLKWW